MSDGIDAFRHLLREMRNSFVAELPERCERIEKDLLDLEARPNSRETFNELYRNVHSLKGSGGTHGLVVITNICHQLENILAQFDDAGLQEEAVSMALAHVDLLNQVAERAHDENEPYADIQNALADLQPKLQQGRHSVLIAESSAMMAKLCQKALAREGIQLTLVKDGITALQHLTRDHYDLLVLGRELAQLNGAAVVAALQTTSSRNSQMPVILITSNQTDLPSYIRIDRVVERDNQLATRLSSAFASLMSP